MKALRVYSKFIPISVLFLIFFGALVKSHEAGLAVPDWPTTFGKAMFLYPISEWKGGVLYEHGHRLIASAIGLFTVILTGWILLVDRRKWLKTLSFIALFAVIIQGILGGLTVKYQLPTLISVSHAVLAQTFFLITIAIAYFLSEEFSKKINQLKNNKFFSYSLVLLILVFLQLIVGALMRHTESGLAVPDFPTMGGSLIPSLSDATLTKINAMLSSIGLQSVATYQVFIHLLHRFGGVIITLGIFLLLFYSFYKNLPKVFLRNVSLLGGITIIQFALGIFTILTRKEPFLTSVHVACGAITLGLLALLCLRSYVTKNNC